MNAQDDATLRGLVGYNMKRAFNAIHADLAVTLAPFGLRMVTWSALSVIHDSPGLRQSHLADVLSIERPNLVILIDELEAADLILRERDATDRRAYRLTMTPAGQAIFDKVMAAVTAHEHRMMAGFTADETASLVNFLRRIEAQGHLPHAAQTPHKG